MVTVTLRGDDLKTILTWLQDLAENVHPYELRVGIDGEGFKLSANRGTWSPGKGSSDYITHMFGPMS